MHGTRFLEADENTAAMLNWQVFIGIVRNIWRPPDWRFPKNNASVQKDSWSRVQGYSCANCVRQTTESLYPNQIYKIQASKCLACDIRLARRSTIKATRDSAWTIARTYASVTSTQGWRYRVSLKPNWKLFIKMGSIRCGCWSKKILLLMRLNWLIQPFDSKTTKVFFTIFSVSFCIVYEAFVIAGTCTWLCVPFQKEV